MAWQTSAGSAVARSASIGSQPDVGRVTGVAAERAGDRARLAKLCICRADDLERRMAAEPAAHTAGAGEQVDNWPRLRQLTYLPDEH